VKQFQDYWLETRRKSFPQPLISVKLLVNVEQVALKD
jgi:hypothetical protein